MASVIYSQGTLDIAVAANDKVAIYSRSPVKLYQKVGYPNHPDTWDIITTTTAGSEYTSAAFSAAGTIRMEASEADAFYEIGTAPSVFEPTPNLTMSEAVATITGLGAAQGGSLEVKGGASSTAANAGGEAKLTGGIPGATGVGGAATVAGGAGGATSGAGGVASVTGGAGTAGNSAGGVGKVVGGAGAGNAAGGAAQVTGGAAGGATGTGGAATVTGGAGNTTGAGGAASVTGGAGAGTGAGGAASLVGGASGAGATGDGGDVALTGGAATSTNGNGGAVILTGGAATGTGVAGMVISRSVELVNQGAPAAKTTSATLTAAEVLTGIITVNQGGGGASAQQLPLATAMDTAVPDSAAGDAFDFSVINISINAAEDASVTTNTGWTLVGNMDIASNAAATDKSAGRFRARKTGAGAWTLYRLS